MIPTVTVIPFRNECELTERLTWDIAVAGLSGPILLVNNNSDPDQLASVRELAKIVNKLAKQEIVVIWDERERNIDKMWNHGLKLGKEWARDQGVFEWNVAVLNNDLIVPGRFLHQLAHFLRADPRLWAVCPNYDNRRTEHPLQQVHGTFAQGGMSGFAFMVAGEKLDNAGVRFDETIAWWFSDDDMVQQIEAHGGHVALARDVPVIHYGSASTTWDDETKLLISHDRDRYRSKWGIEDPIRLPWEADGAEAQAEGEVQAR